MSGKESTELALIVSKQFRLECIKYTILAGSIRSKCQIINFSIAGSSMGEIVNHIMSEKESTELALIVSRKFRLECIKYTILEGSILSKCQIINFSIPGSSMGEIVNHIMSEKESTELALVVSRKFRLECIKYTILEGSILSKCQIINFSIPGSSMGEIVNHIMSEKESTELALIVSRKFRLECIKYTILEGSILSKCQIINFSIPGSSMGEIVNHIMSEKESTELALIVSRKFRLECIKYTILEGSILSKCQIINFSIPGSSMGEIVNHIMSEIESTELALIVSRKFRLECIKYTILEGSILSKCQIINSSIAGSSMREIVNHIMSEKNPLSSLS